MADAADAFEEGRDFERGDCPELIVELGGKLDAAGYEYAFGGVISALPWHRGLDLLIGTERERLGQVAALVCGDRALQEARRQLLWRGSFTVSPCRIAIEVVALGRDSRLIADRSRVEIEGGTIWRLSRSARRAMAPRRHLRHLVDDVLISAWQCFERASGDENAVGRTPEVLRLIATRNPIERVTHATPLDDVAMRLGSVRGSETLRRLLAAGVADSRGFEPIVVGSLVARLGSTDRKTRIDAAWNLNMLDSVPKIAMAPLLAVYVGDEAGIAGSALGKIDPEHLSAEVGQALLAQIPVRRNLSADEASNVEAAAAALGRLGTSASLAAVDRLLDNATVGEDLTRWTSLHLLGLMLHERVSDRVVDRVASRIVDVIRRLPEGMGWRFMPGTIQLLGNLGAAAPEVVAFFEQKLGQPDSDWLDVSAAIEALGHIGAPARACLPQLEALPRSYGGYDLSYTIKESIARLRHGFFDEQPRETDRRVSRRAAAEVRASFERVLVRAETGEDWSLTGVEVLLDSISKMEPPVPDFGSELRRFWKLLRHSGHKDSEYVRLSAEGQIERWMDAVAAVGRTALDENVLKVLTDYARRELGKSSYTAWRALWRLQDEHGLRFRIDERAARDAPEIFHAADGPRPV